METHNLMRKTHGPADDAAAKGHTADAWLMSARAAHQARPKPAEEDMPAMVSSMARVALRRVARHQNARMMSGIVSSGLKERLTEQMPAKQAELKAIKAEHGSKIVDTVTVDQLIGGARSIKAMLWETSLLDPVEGIRFRGYSIPELQEKLCAISISNTRDLWLLYCCFCCFCCFCCCCYLKCCCTAAARNATCCAHGLLLESRREGLPSMALLRVSRRPKASSGS